MSLSAVLCDCVVDFAFYSPPTPAPKLSALTFRAKPDRASYGIPPTQT